MLIAPDALSEGDLTAALARGWGLTPASVTYLPVGWGSHHWEIADDAGTRWFVTVDQLQNKQETLAETLDVAFGRMRAALGTAIDLRADGNETVLAPLPATDGEPLARIGAEFAVAVYPFIDGQGFQWNAVDSAQHRLARLELVLAVHTASPATRRRALTDEFVIPHRDELEALLDGAVTESLDAGPYTRRVAELITGNAEPIRSLLARYDGLAARARSQPSRLVLTHGEPHPGNTMVTAQGWKLIDWDTALLAPPERDLWALDPGDGTILAAYAEATGVRPLAGMNELYRIRWDLADIAIDVSRFMRRHSGTAEDDKAWGFLSGLVTGIAVRR